MNKWILIVAGLLIGAPGVMAHTTVLSQHSITGDASDGQVLSIHGQTPGEAAAFTEEGLLVQNANSGVWETRSPTTTVQGSESGCVFGEAPDRLIYYFSLTDQEVSLGTEQTAEDFTWNNFANTGHARNFAAACFSETNVYGGGTNGDCEQFTGTGGGTTCAGLDRIGAGLDLLGLGAITDAASPDSNAAAVYADSERRTRIDGITTIHPGGTQDALDVECVGKTFCVAVGNDRYYSIWNGTGWSNATMGGAEAGLTVNLKSVACITPVRCYAVGYTTPLSEDSRTSVRMYHYDGTTFHNTSILVPRTISANWHTIWSDPASGTLYIGGSGQFSTSAAIFSFITTPSGSGGTTGGSGLGTGTGVGGFEPDSIFGQTVAMLQEAWGFSAGSLNWLLGIMVVGLVAVSFARVNRTPLMVAIGGMLGVGLALFFGFFPLWLLVLMAFLIIAVAGNRLFGGGRDDE